VSQLDRHLTTEQLSLLLDQAITSSEGTVEPDSTDLDDLQVHLRDCEQCQQELAELRQTVMLLRAMPQPQLPRAFALPVGILQTPARAESVSISQPVQPVALHAQRQKQRKAMSMRLVLRTASGLAAAIGILCVLSGLFNGIPFLSNTSNGNRGIISLGQPSGIERNGSLVTPKTTNTNDQQSPHRGNAAQQAPTPATAPPTSAPRLVPSTQPQSAGSSPINSILNILSFILGPEGRVGTGILLFLIGACGFTYFKQHTKVAEGP
jgi:hypothetical protein